MGGGQRPPQTHQPKGKGLEPQMEEQHRFLEGHYQRRPYSLWERFGNTFINAGLALSHLKTLLLLGVDVLSLFSGGWESQGNN